MYEMISFGDMHIWGKEWCITNSMVSLEKRTDFTCVLRSPSFTLAAPYHGCLSLRCQWGMSFPGLQTVLEMCGGNIVDKRCSLFSGLKLPPKPISAYVYVRISYILFPSLSDSHIVLLVVAVVFVFSVVAAVSKPPIKQLPNQSFPQCYLIGDKNPQRLVWMLFLN